MVKRIVLFSDGTGNSSASVFKTNVWRLYDSLDLSQGEEQIACFDDGVGSSSDKRIASITGSIGIGLKRNVLDLYKFLSREYANALGDLRARYPDRALSEIPKDELPKISCFGFSRGAFTVRVLAGLVYRQGLLTEASEAEMDWLAKRAYAEYRRAAFRTKYGLDWLYGPPYYFCLRLLDKIMLSEKGGYDVRRNLPAVNAPTLQDGREGIVEFDFLGLWDTVGAYGMPFEEFRIAIDKWIFPLTFADQKPLPCIRVIRHALSIDDDRDAFTPIAFWDADQRKISREARWKIFNQSRAADADDDEAIEKAWRRPEPCLQMWFAGVHANVDGGYPDDSMAYEPLRWMLEQAIKCDAIKVRPAARAEIASKATPFGQIYDARAGFGGLYRYKPRDIVEALLPEGAGRTYDHLPIVHKSVMFRAADRFFGYAPIALPEELLVADDDGRVIHHHKPQSRDGLQQFENPPDAAFRATLDKLNPPTPAQRELVETAVFWRRFFIRSQSGQRSFYLHSRFWTMRRV